MTENLTPMMQQYQRIKREIPAGALLLFRLGDFYEMFFDDAKITSKALNLTLTQRNTIPMCGIPHHAAENYITKLIQAGHKVAICDQLEEAGAGKGIVKRGVTQILSPGTMMGDGYLSARKNNFIAAVGTNGSKQDRGLAILDISTGDFRLTEFSDNAGLIAELKRLSPAELLIPNEDKSLNDDLQALRLKLTAHDSWTFEYETAFLCLRDHFKTQSLDGFGCQTMKVAICAAGALMHYLRQQLRRELNHVHKIHVYHADDFMSLDPITQKNIDLLESSHGTPETTLVGCIDRTVTAMGGRTLRDWISHPLQSVQPIQSRHQVVAELFQDQALLSELREKLHQVQDLERMVARLSSSSGNARDLIGLKLTLQALPGLRQILIQLHSPLAKEQVNRIQEFPQLIDLIDRAISDEPPLALKEGGLIKTGYDSNLDELRTAMNSGKEWIAKLQQEEIERTGIKSLKVRFNSVFGYYIEVTSSNLNQVPAHYIRKQTVATGERFITPELKEMENKILGAQERSFKLEYEIFQQIRGTVAQESAAVQEAARAIATIDILGGFAELARHQNYVRPQIDDSNEIEIIEGRHPVLEQLLVRDVEHMGKGGFIPNDTTLDAKENQILVITGPNMAGKSTFIRQVAVIVLLAQVGSFVPAKSAKIGLVDQIFTRVGASDDLSRGQSTFMVEMNETANILNNATEKSLVILDEIGRGTSTYDGISIAWSVAEYLHEMVKCKTLFATHYHELTSMSQKFKRIKNFNVAVREWNDEIIFLRKIQPGGADRSYGIQVARLAGLPKEVIERAKEILGQLEASHSLTSKSELEKPTDVKNSKKLEPKTESEKKVSSTKKKAKQTSQMLLFAAGKAPK